VLIRHGEGRSSVDRVVGGPKGCTGLSDAGRDQADRLRARLERSGELRADAVLVSVLPRAVETAQLVMRALGGAELVTDCELCEVHVGEADGLSIEEARSALWMARSLGDATPGPVQKASTNSAIVLPRRC